MGVWRMMLSNGRDLVVMKKIWRKGEIKHTHLVFILLTEFEGCVTILVDSVMIWGCGW
jgi:hypothetical protein